MSGVHLPFVEGSIAVSVLVLGLLIAGAVKFPLPIGAIVAGLFAAFHGHAHGAEMPIAIGAVSYTAGFVLTTGLLQATGIVAGIALRKPSNEKLASAAGYAIAATGVWLVLP